MPGSASTKCCSSISKLRRFICQCSLPTHPADEMLDYDTKSTVVVLEKSLSERQDAVSSPGVVARLMGLESLPNTQIQNGRTTLASYIRRSRSVNSIDFLAQFDPSRNRHHAHRRIRTSVSFRETVDDNFHGLYREDFLIRRRPKPQDLKQGRKAQVLPKNRKKAEVEKTGKRSTGNKVTTNTRKNGIPPRKNTISSSNTKSLRAANSEKTKTRKPLEYKVKRVHPEGYVPDVIGKLDSHRNPGSGNNHRPAPSVANFDNGEARAKRKTKKKEESYYRRLFEEICGLAEEGVESDWSNGMMVWEFEEEMSQRFEHEILQVLLERLVIDIFYS